MIITAFILLLLKQMSYKLLIITELFFQRGPFKAGEDVLLSKPMKGTMPRGSNETEDKQNLNTLRHSSKDRAENVMIVGYYVMT